MLLDLLLFSAAPPCSLCCEADRFVIRWYGRIRRFQAVATQQRPASRRADRGLRSRRSDYLTFFLAGAGRMNVIIALLVGRDLLRHCR